MNSGQIIKSAREEKGITRAELARAIDIPISTLIGYENGRFMPKASNITKLCIYLHINADYLLGLDKSTDKPY